MKSYAEKELAVLIKIRDNLTRVKYYFNTLKEKDLPKDWDLSEEELRLSRNKLYLTIYEQLKYLYEIRDNIPEMIVEEYTETKEPYKYKSDDFVRKEAKIITKQDSEDLNWNIFNEIEQNE